MENVRIGRQPILDEDSNIVAYTLMYREKIQSNYTTASLISNVLNKFGREALLGDKRAFITVDEKFLLHDLILSVPAEFFVFSLSSSIAITPRIIERVELLHARGYLLGIEHIGLNDVLVEQYEPIINRLSFAKIDIREDADASIKEIVFAFKASGITVVGDNIYDSEQFERAKEFGCDWFEGYYFAELKIVENAKYEASSMEVLKLYRLLMEDVNIDEITKEFESNYEITLQLLQFINSGAFHFKKRISSVHHILTLVGRIPLGQWLMLMIYSKSVSNRKGASALMLMVKNRTELMQKILKLLRQDAGSNMLGEAYFVGVLSLIDTLFGMHLQDVLTHVKISTDVESALLREEGLLGEILALTKKIEAFDVQAVTAFEEKHKIKDGLINEIILTSLESVQALENPTPLAE